MLDKLNVPILELHWFLNNFKECPRKPLEDKVKKVLLDTT